MNAPDFTRVLRDFREAKAIEADALSIKRGSDRWHEIRDEEEQCERDDARYYSLFGDDE